LGTGELEGSKMRFLAVCVTISMFLSMGFVLNMSPTLHYGNVDLYIEETDLTFNPASPVALGQSVSIEAVVHLTGGLREILWTKQGVSLDIGPNPDYYDLHIISPRILIENGTYKMWYSSSEGVHYHIAYATSADGISWTKHGMVLDIGNPGEPDDTHVAYHWILKEGSLYKMWYSGLDEYTPYGGIYRIFYATSADGLSWTKHGVVVDADSPGGPGYPLTNRPCLLNENGTYKMWYSGLDEAGIRRILYATSPDGVSWTKHGIVFDAGPPGGLEVTGVTTPFVVRREGRYLMWYAGLKGSEARMFLATSPDGLSWTRGGLVLDLGPPGSDDDVRLTEPFIEFSGGVPKQMWYAARGSNYKILRATASLEPVEIATSVSFYLDGMNPSDEIGHVDDVVVPHDGSATASISWIAGPIGNHTICVRVDPDDVHSETSELNNTACREIEVVAFGPEADAGGPYTGHEGESILFDGGNSIDPNGDPLQYRWDFDADGLWDTGWSGKPQATHAWGDDYSGLVYLEVSDGNSTDVDSAEATILNVNPSVGAIDCMLNISFAFRIAGEKWHNVEVHLFEDGVEIGYANITRYPGSPNDQMAILTNASVDLSGNYSLVAYYTPFDDPVNGEVWGADPAWLILTSADGESRAHHTFNVRHEETWTWHLQNVSLLFLRHNITFAATAYDPGSDDLTFDWDWGDGDSTVNTHYNDGIGPDPPQSPEINPINVTDSTLHSYSLPGACTIVLMVIDDDGGTSATSLTIGIG
jgi:hypothetical protein